MHHCSVIEHTNNILPHTAHYVSGILVLYSLSCCKILLSVFDVAISGWVAFIEACIDLLMNKVDLNLL